MLSFPTCFTVLNIFLEDFNRYGFKLNLGDTISYTLAPGLFLGNIMFAYWVHAKGTSFNNVDPNVLVSDLGNNIMNANTVILLGCVGIKAVKEIALGRKYSYNYVLFGIALASIVFAAQCQEKVGIFDLPCDPTSLF